MGLAEPRKKQRIAADPQNRQWLDGASQRGSLLLQKMGWQAGTGLGRDGQGQVDHIRVQRKFDSHGVGADVRTADNWLDSTDAFAEVLAHLNSSQPDAAAETPSPKSTTQPLSLRLAHRRKFVRGKAVSSYSASDMAAILGERNDAPATPAAAEPAPETTSVLVSKTCRTDEYFAGKTLDPKLRALLGARLGLGASSGPAKDDSSRLERKQARAKRRQEREERRQARAARRQARAEK